MEVIAPKNCDKCNKLEKSALKSHLIVFHHECYKCGKVQKSSFEVFTHLLVKHPEVKLNQAKTYLDCDRCDMVKEILRFRYSRSFLEQKENIRLYIFGYLRKKNCTKFDILI